jgi:D-alanyl-D-alanine carboxypeptidase
MSGNVRTGEWGIQVSQKASGLRGSGHVALGLVGVFAVTTIAVLPADAKHYRANVSTHEHEHSSSDHASSSPPYSAIVVDANTGSVLQSANADELRHPASLTKIMTLYLLFERLEVGKIKLDTQMPVSEHASVQSPTKLGLKAGHTIAVEDAIKGLVTKSANDAAVVVAEALGGSEGDFAEMMTRKAHALGMTHTLYRNASGLPNDEQVTTAREQALLGRAIQERFPRYYRYFSTSSFTYHGETMSNHNHLLGHVEGVDGIKTGYTQASGFNLVTSVHRGNHFIVAVVLGGSSAGARDAKMRSLIEEHIAHASTQHTAPLIAEGNVATPVARTAEARTDAKVRTAPTESVAAKPQTAEAKTDVKVKSYEVASVPQQQWPASKFAAAAAEAESASAPAPAPAKTAAASARLASVGDDDTIRPIPVKTIKVKLAQTQPAALAPVASGSTQTVDAAAPFRMLPGKPAAPAPVAAAQAEPLDPTPATAVSPAPVSPAAATAKAAPPGETAVISPASVPAAPAEPPVATPAKAPHRAPTAKTGGMMLAEATPPVLIAAPPPLAAPAAAPTPSPVASAPASEASIIAALTTRPAPATTKSPAPAPVAATPAPTPVTAAPAASTVIAAAAPVVAPVPPTPVAAAPAATTIIATAAPAAAPVATPISAAPAATTVIAAASAAAPQPLAEPTPKAARPAVMAGLTQTTPAETPAEPVAATPVTNTAPPFPPVQAYKPTPRPNAPAAAVEASTSEAKPLRAVRAGWVIQVGAFDAEHDAQQRLTKAQAKIGHVLDRADPFTETVLKGEKTLYRARFAGFQQKDEAEAVCKQLKRNDIDCMTIKN